MKLRPHHLLCTQGFGGRGYSTGFVANMTAITNRLRSGDKVLVDLVFTTDDICAECPKMLGADRCEDNAKVKRFDQKTADYFGLEQKCYDYQELVGEIRSKITEAMMNDICSGCNWYPISACKRNILNAAAE